MMEEGGGVLRYPAEQRNELKDCRRQTIKKCRKVGKIFGKSKGLVTEP